MHQVAWMLLFANICFALGSAMMFDVTQTHQQVKQRWQVQ